SIRVTKIPCGSVADVTFTVTVSIALGFTLASESLTVIVGFEFNVNPPVGVLSETVADTLFLLLTFLNDAFWPSPVEMFCTTVLGALARAGVVELARAGVVELARAGVVELARAGVVELARAGVVELARAGVVEL